MKLLVAALLLVLVIAVFVAIARAMQARAATGARWELEERSERGRVIVRAVRPGAGEALVVGAAVFDDPEFELRIEELRSEGRAKVIALNSGLPSGRR